MSKKLYTIDVNNINFPLHKDVTNPTCVSIIKALHKMSQDEKFQGSTGDNILRYALRHNLWSTKQDDDKLMTTWAYYVKKLMTHGGVKELGKESSVTIKSLQDLIG